MSSLTPPRFIKMLRERDKQELRDRLLVLADKWEGEADAGHPDAQTLRDCAARLRAAILD